MEATKEMCVRATGKFKAGCCTRPAHRSELAVRAISPLVLFKPGHTPRATPQQGEARGAVETAMQSAHTVTGIHVRRGANWAGRPVPARADTAHNTGVEPSQHTVV